MFRIPHAEIDVSKREGSYADVLQKFAVQEAVWLGAVVSLERNDATWHSLRDAFRLTGVQGALADHVINSTSDGLAAELYQSFRSDPDAVEIEDEVLARAAYRVAAFPDVRTALQLSAIQPRAKADATERYIEATMHTEIGNVAKYTPEIAETIRLTFASLGTARGLETTPS